MTSINYNSETGMIIKEKRTYFRKRDKGIILPLLEDSEKS